MTVQACADPGWDPPVVWDMSEGNSFKYLNGREHSPGVQSARVMVLTREGTGLMGDILAGGFSRQRIQLM